MEYQPAPTPSYSASASAPVPASVPMPSDPRLERPVSTPFAAIDIRSIKTACEYSMGEYLALQKRRRYDDPASGDRLLTQQGIVMSDLQALRSEVADLAKTAESHRWRRWILSGLAASFIPAVRRIFRRSSKDNESNDTEYAFKRSKSLIGRILDSVRGKGKLASVAFFVLAILYVFQSEVSIRVARTISKRLKRLMAKVERGDQGLGDDDMKILKGWRWRVLLW
ncbi:uncharacterized protein GGS22DRAFT_182842 [Annulohypoxylon maeteangense]|uniref:uncharacterized protein n=1 Tax=Annulohypoxylon maeteangense TaxID=1927788 RepID=UPI0020074F57|nr:uncharacterized protein GGS22DRAFT_182842 [Annulohypoxylon maeteangense]KAI0889497.1 hypothetical protein GGS22DRAFT_182842 [Annulohypoxylon maeteangense]